MNEHPSTYTHNEEEQDRLKLWTIHCVGDGTLALYTRLCECEPLHKDGYFNSLEEIEKHIQKELEKSLYEQGYDEGTCSCGKVVVTN